MRVALVSPYSWTHPGGVTRHIEALSAELLAAGHHVRILAPYDGDPAGAPDELISLGRTIGLPFNGAVSNLALTPFSAATLRRELRTGAFDVVHVHEPVAPVPGWLALAVADSPLVGTFHTYTERVAAHAVAALWGSRRNLNRLHVRIAVSEAAAWTARRFIGGEYRIVPNGVVLPPGGAPAPRARRPGEPLEIAFVGQAVTRKGLPVLLRAYEALREHVPARLTVIGAGEGDLAPLLDDTRGVTALGRADDAEKRAALERAHVLCAPSLGGESFGMVLTEAFAAGTPVVASDIAGYRDVVEHGRDGLLVPPGDAVALGEALHDLALDAPRLERLSVRAGRSAEEYAWPRVAAQVMEAYEDAIAVPAPAGATARAAVKLGFRSAAGGPRRPARRLPPLDPRPTRAARVGRLARRAAPLAGVAAAAGGALLALQHIGWDAVAESVIASSPAWAVLAVALMVASMVLRAVSWHAILKAALPASRPRFVDSLQGTSIGVLMSATLPARLGEPSRALIVARRLGRPRELLPAVLGTLISQTMLNLLALAVLGTVMFQTVGLFAGRQSALVYYARRAVRGAVLRARRAGADPLRPHVALAAGPGLGGRGALRAHAGALGPGRLPPAEARRRRHPDPAPRLGRPMARLLRAARGPRARRPGRRHRRGRGGAVRGQRHRGAAAHAVEPRRLPGRLRGGADERLPRERRATRSATGSSSRRSSSPPPSSWARPRW